jgi:outer membrane receptor protein involved in Fe transport
VGLYETTLAAYPDVSVYVDQVPLPLAVLTPFVGLDLERVEILKGPQGVLFGQNSTGGAINYIAAKPTATPSAGLDVGYGRFDDTTVDGFVSGPLSDTIRARLSFQVEEMGPWQRSYHLPVDGRNGSISTRSARLLIDWQPNDRLKLELNLNGGVDQSQPIAPQFIGVALQQLLPGGVPGPNGRAILAYPFAPNNAEAADFSNNNHPWANNNQYQASLRADYNLTDDLTLTSISSYAHYNRDEHVEFGGIALEDEELTQDFGHVDSVFQELRLANGAKNRVRWTLGANYEHDYVYEYNFYAYPGSSAPDVTGLTGTPFYSIQKMNNYAAFADVAWDITRQFTIEGGTRFTESDRSAKLCTQGGDNTGIDALFDTLMSAFHGGQVYPPLTQNDCITLDPATLLSVRQGYISTLNEGNVSGRVNLNYKPTDNILFYVNVTKGYKAGGFPMLSASTSYQYLPVRQESVVDYEGGFKLGLLDRTLQLDGSVFHYDYHDKQIRTQTVQPIFGILNNLQNVPKSTVDGAELEIAWRPVRGLNISASGTYLDAKIVQFVGTNADGIRENYAGAAVPYTPRYSSNVSADYRWSLTDRLDVSLGGTLTQRSKSFATVGPTPIDTLPPYVLLDLRGSIMTKDGRYRVEIWGKNVTDKFYWTNVSHPYDTVVRYAGMPATWGVTFGARF